jgi:hypothetical protein
VWLGEVPLKVSYVVLYEMSRDPGALVRDLVKNGEWMVEFRRRLDGNLEARWEDPVGRLGEVVITEEDGRVIWALEKGALLN